MKKKPAKKVPLYKDPKQSVEVRVKDLLKRMTLEEKGMQLVQRGIGQDMNPNNRETLRDFDPRLGSVLSYGGLAKKRNAFQRLAMENTRLGIPIIWGFDVIHGWRTGFPCSIAQACSFRPELTEKLSRVAAEEAWNDGGIDWTFSPMVEVCHDPRWGRVVEGYGEDPLTAQIFTQAAVLGYQGRTPEELKKPGRIAACLKHFVGYSASEGGRDYAYTDISNRALWEYYLPPFEAGVDAGARTLMSSFNDICGTPAHCNSYTLDEILRKRWGFTGFVVADWAGVKQLGIQRYSSDPAVQTVSCLTAGTDMDMADSVYENIPQLVKDGLLSEKVLNQAVARVLRVKFELGLFEHPYAPELPTEQTCMLPASRELALQVARESIVLLKNDHKTLPLKPQKIKNIALIGPGANNTFAHIGSWSAFTDWGEKGAPSLLTKVKEAFPKATITTAEGCDFAKPGEKGFTAAKKIAKQADIVLLAIGENGHMSGEYKSRRDINLPGSQVKLIEELRKAVGPEKPMVALVTSGRPLAFQDSAKLLDAILFLWQSGHGAAQATMEILTGKINPSGKLSMTFPRSVGQIPTFVNEHHKARFTDDYQDVPEENGPWLPFGHGLSYSNFVYGKVETKCTDKGAVEVSVEVTNKSKIAGSETVIWYLSDLEASLTQSEKRVVAFEKLDFAPGETKRVTLTLSPFDLACLGGEDGSTLFEDGDFTISASGKSEATFSYEYDEEKLFKPFATHDYLAKISK